MRALVVALALTIALVQALPADVNYADFSRYQVILDRKPFGDEPREAVDITIKLEESVFKDWRVVAVTESGGGEVKVGLFNAASGKSYYLAVGDTEDGMQVVDADYDAEAALLRKGAEEIWLSMGAASIADGAAPEGAGGAAVGVSGRGRDVTAEMRVRRRKETVRKIEAEAPKMTNEELEKHLKEYQMELIRKGEPPLPIALTKEMDDQLVKEGVLPPLE